ncbi:MAG TPA: cyanophycin synthetase, partial [Planctomycetaceae bacterium]|nr:cyanophycin synthetase [Planctomycetaceae bacterium]
RMQVAGARPTAEQMIELVRRVQPAVRQCESDPPPFSPTFFEVTTALAWLFFLQQKAQIVVLEVGLGGRLDSTNVCLPVACVLTTISRDHTQILGSSLSQIAREKAGIVKAGVPVISGVTGEEALAVIHETCRTQNADLWQLGREFSYIRGTGLPTASVRERDGFGQAGSLPHEVVNVTTPLQTWTEMPLPLIGEHQAHNAAVALATIDRLRDAGWTVSPEAARRGLSKVRWPMRIEVVRCRPTVIVDAAHNWESASALGRTLDEAFPTQTSSGEFSRRVLIFAATKDKDVAGILRQLLPRFDSIIFTKYLNNPRSVAPEHLVRLIQLTSDIPCHVSATPAEAWQLARRIAAPSDLICVTGSFFIAAELRELILREPA